MITLTAITATAGDISIVNKTGMTIMAYFDLTQGRQLKKELTAGKTATVTVKPGELNKIQLDPRSDKVRGQYIFADDAKAKQTYTLTLSGMDIIVTPS